MPKSPKCTVILTSYNRTFELKECILSVLAQTLEDFEFFIIDDGSGPKTRKIIEKFEALDPRIKYIQTDYDGERIGSDICRYARNINVCLKECSGEYITYLTDDDIFYPNHLESLSKMLDEDPEKMIVFGRQKMEAKDHGWRTTYNGARPVMTEPVRDAAGVVDHNSVLHRKTLIDEVGYWPEDGKYWPAADGWFFYKIRDAGHLFYPCEEVTSCHRLHKNAVQYKMGTYEL